MTMYSLYSVNNRDNEYVLSPSYRTGMSERAFRQIAKGDYIVYLLPPSARPTNPLREWHGCVLAIGQDAVLVTTLDDGYAGHTEVVRRSEIVSVGA